MSSHHSHRSKLSMSWLDLKIWLEEQRDVLIHSYIDNLHYIKDRYILLLKLYNNIKGVVYWLIVEPSKRISIVSSDLRFGDIEDVSQKIWRTLLKNCIITNVHQVPCERILFIELNCRSTVRKLVVEFLPRGAVCILNAQNKILLCSEYKSMRDRTIKPGLQYILPPAASKCVESLSQAIKLTQLEQSELLRILIKSFGLPPDVVETIIYQCGLNNKPITEVTEEDLMCIDSLYKTLTAITVNNYRPCIVFDSQNVALGFYPYIPQHFDLNRYRIELYPTLNDAINKYYEEEFKSLILFSVSQEVQKKINDIKVTINNIDHLINELRKKLDALNIKLKIVENNYVELERTHQCMMERIKTLGWKDIAVCGPIIGVSPEKGLYTIKLDDVILEFDIRRNFIENYNNLRKTLSGVEKAIIKAEKEKDELTKELQKLIEELKLREVKVKHKLSRRRGWYETYIWFITSSGFLVIGGKDASQNIKIIRRLLEPNDIVLHADIHGASTVVIKTQNKIVNYDDIKEAAVIAACYSKAWKLGLASIDVFWVYGSQVSLSPPPGQFLPKGSYMVYGERNYINNVELKLAIGIEITDNSFRVITGPEEVISKRAIAYFVVVPGSYDPKSVATNFIEFLKSKNLIELATILDASDIIGKLPGKCNIIKKVAKNLFSKVDI